MAYTKRPSGGIKVEYATALTWLGPWIEVDGFKGAIKLPGGTAKKVVITTHTDIRTRGRFERNASGISDITDPGGTLLYDPDDLVHIAMEDAWANGTILQFRFTVPNVSRKRGVEGQVSLGEPTGDTAGYLETPFMVIANDINLNVA